MFSIGETAKINKISIQTLRHYDKENILKPIYVDKESGYRYYSIEQFIQIDFIKRCKILGFSLEEIREILQERNSLEDILKTIELQKKVIKEKIESLKNIEESIEFLEKKIKKGIERENKEPVVEKFQILEIVSSGNINITTSHELEMEFRKYILEIEKEYNILDLLFIMKVDKKNFLDTGKTQYSEILIGINKTKDSNLKCIEGIGISVYAESAAFKNREIYEKIISFEREQGYKTQEYFYEIYYLSKLNIKNEEYSLLNIINPLYSIKD